MGRQSFLESEELLGRQERKSSYEGPYHVVRKMVWGVFSDRGRRTTNWLGVGKVCDLPNFHAKIDSTNTKNIGDNFTEVTIFIIIIKR